MLLISNYRIQLQTGFTLIEMTIAIAIVGILASIATTNYQVQVRKTQLITIYQELNHFSMPYQILVDEGSGVTDFSPNGLNMPVQSQYCQFSVTPPNINSATPNAIRCQIQNLNYLKNQHLSLDRELDGSWRCQASAGISNSYLPQACQ